MKSIVGTWRLIKTSARNDAGEPMHPPYGEKPRGLVVFYPDKRMMSVLPNVVMACWSRRGYSRRNASGVRKLMSIAHSL